MVKRILTHLLHPLLRLWPGASPEVQVVWRETEIQGVARQPQDRKLSPVDFVPPVYPTNFTLLALHMYGCEKKGRRFSEPAFPAPDRPGHTIGYTMGVIVMIGIMVAWPFISRSWQ